MSKAKKLLHELYGDKYEVDYGYHKETIDGHLIGEFKLGLGDGSVDIQLPLSNIDPDYDNLIIPLQFTYEHDDPELRVGASLNLDIKKYWAADDGKLHDLTPEKRSKVIDYIKKSRIEDSLEDFIYEFLKDKSGD